MSYNKSKDEFLRDIENRTIADDVLELFKKDGGGYDVEFDRGEYRAWRHSLTEMYFVLKDPLIRSDLRIILEYRLIDTNKRIDMLICSPNYESMIVVELKQWSTNKEKIHNRKIDYITNAFIKYSSIKEKCLDEENKKIYWSSDLPVKNAIISTHFYYYNLAYLISLYKKNLNNVIGKNINWCIYLHNWDLKFEHDMIKDHKNANDFINGIRKRIFYKKELIKFKEFIIENTKFNEKSLDDGKFKEFIIENTKFNEKSLDDGKFKEFSDSISKIILKNIDSYKYRFGKTLNKILNSPNTKEKKGIFFILFTKDQKNIQSLINSLGNISYSYIDFLNDKAENPANSDLNFIFINNNIHEKEKIQECLKKLKNFLKKVNPDDIYAFEY